MDDREERIAERAKRITKEEGASHGRDPENMDPEMLEGEAADIVRANKAMKQGGEAEPDEAQPLTPAERLPPD